jgi:hypothetical protein
MCYYTYEYVQQGWQCPKCKVVYSPSTLACYCCTSQVKVTTSSNTTNFIFCGLCGEKATMLQEECLICGEQLNGEKDD